jgi:hypothetical protein
MFVWNEQHPSRQQKYYGASLKGRFSFWDLNCLILLTR